MQEGNDNGDHNSNNTHSSSRGLPASRAFQISRRGVSNPPVPVANPFRRQRRRRRRLPTSQPDYLGLRWHGPAQDPTGPSGPTPSTQAPGQPVLQLPLRPVRAQGRGGAPQQGMTGLLARGRGAPGTNQLGEPLQPIWLIVSVVSFKRQDTVLRLLLVVFNQGSTAMKNLSSRRGSSRSLSEPRPRTPACNSPSASAARLSPASTANSRVTCQRRGQQPSDHRPDRRRRVRAAHAGAMRAFGKIEQASALVLEHREH